MEVDANLWISAYLLDDVHHTVCRQWLVQQLATREQLVIPTLALAEVARAIARRTGAPALGHAGATEILRTPRLRIVGLNEQLGRQAARIAADLRLRGADAVYVAVAQCLCIPLVTWDLELQRRASALISVLQP